MSDALKLLVGLGNPGPEYALTRHNAGFWYLDKLANHYQLNFKYEKRFNAALCHINQDGIDCRLCKPQTFMNESGSPIQALIQFYKLKLGQVLIAHDELDLAPGVIRLKQAGGHGGHNGLRDLIHRLGGNDFSRLRIGIGHPGLAKRVTSYVLNRPSATDKERLHQALDHALSYSTAILSGRLPEVMNTLNQKPSPQPDNPS